MRYAVVIEKAGESWTVGAVEHDIREAIRFHLEGLREDGQDVPPPSSIIEYVDA